MLDDIRSDDGLNTDGRDRGRRVPPQAERQITDREVPLPQPADRPLSAAVHAWLDGELDESAVAIGETARDVEFWKRLNDAATSHRNAHAPKGLADRIMAALPASGIR
jgi:hypothetical protein